MLRWGEGAGGGGGHCSELHPLSPPLTPPPPPHTPTRTRTSTPPMVRLPSRARPRTAALIFEGPGALAVALGKPRPATGAMGARPPLAHCPVSWAHVSQGRAQTPGRCPHDIGPGPGAQVPN